jgi:type III secretion protein HrpB1
MNTTDNTDARGLVRPMVAALRDGRLDEAEAMLDQISVVYPTPDDLVVFAVLIAIQRGQCREALCHLEALPGDAHPELKAFCLYLLGEPCWEGMAQTLEDSPDQSVRLAMKALLGRSLEAEFSS